jgi:hypothetical protein
MPHTVLRGVGVKTAPRLQRMNFRSPDLRDLHMTPVSKNSGKAHQFHGG